MKQTSLFWKLCASYILVVLLSISSAILVYSIAHSSGRSALICVSFATLVVMLTSALLAYTRAGSVTKPLRIMREAATRYAQGDFSPTLPDSSMEELSALTTSLNDMALQLDERIKQLFYEKQTRESVFEAMTEGLLVIDAKKHIIHINPSAARLLRIDLDTAKGQPIEAAVRNNDIQELMKNVMVKDEPIKKEIRVHGHNNIFLVVRGTALQDPSGDRIGALLVMQDVTQVRRLERVRSEFVANVSHELKTPITSIKGFAETLLDDAGSNPEAGQRFLEIISRQADHLNAIITDLLTLSSVEHASTEQNIPLERAALCPILESAVATCQLKADAKEIALDVSCDQAIQVDLSPHLFEQALINLVDNAIKYSPTKSRVKIFTRIEERQYVISIQDEGPGIETQHQERLFERFYRIDKGRSKEMGGTGLGLAIVKHIASVHGGSVSIESRPGNGSIFKIHLPRMTH